MFEPPPRCLYMMAKPPRGPLSRVAGLARKDARRPDLAHVTLLPFVDLRDGTGEFVFDLLARMRGFGPDAFHLAFDRIVERQCVTLRSGKMLQGARRFQRTLIGHLRERGFEYFGKSPEPHLTINYHRDGRGNEVIEPISWRVEEVLLIESVYGQSRHIEHGCWPLNPLLV